MKNLTRFQIWQAAKRNWVLVLIVAGSLIGQTAMTLLQPWPVKGIVDQIISEVPSAGLVTGTQMGLVHFILGSIQEFVTGNEFDFLYKGKVAEEGTHSQLLAKGSLYYRLWQSQMSETRSENDRQPGPSMALKPV